MIGYFGNPLKDLLGRIQTAKPSLFVSGGPIDFSSMSDAVASDTSIYRM